MSRKDKLLERIQRSPVNVSFNDLIRLAEYHGFTIVRIKGSHTIMKHWEKPLFINIQNRNGQAKPYQVRQLLRIIEEEQL